MACNKSSARTVKVRVVNVQGTGAALPSDAEVFARINRASKLFQEYTNITFTILPTYTFKERSAQPGSNDCGPLCCIPRSTRCAQVSLTKAYREQFYEKRLKPFLINKEPDVLLLVNTGLTIQEKDVAALTQSPAKGVKIIWFSPEAVKFYNNPLQKTKEHPYVIAHELGHALGGKHASSKTNLMYYTDTDFKYKDDEGKLLTMPFISDTDCTLFRKSSYTKAAASQSGVVRRPLLMTTRKKKIKRKTV